MSGRWSPPWTAAALRSAPLPERFHRERALNSVLEADAEA